MTKNRYRMTAEEQEEEFYRDKLERHNTRLAEHVTVEQLEQELRNLKEWLMEYVDIRADRLTK